MGPKLEDVQVEQAADDIVVVIFSGDHDLATRDDVRQLFDSLVHTESVVVADFSSASFVDAAIIGVLLDTSDRARELGGTFRLQLGTAAVVRRAFEVCRVFDVVEHVATRDEALARSEA
jgi:anti-anti-sigma factor